MSTSTHPRSVRARPEVALPEVSARDVEALERYRRRNWLYHQEVDRYFRFAVPKGQRVLEVGCSTGRLLAGLEPSSGVGIDVDPRRVAAARMVHSDRPELTFEVADADTWDASTHDPFDAIVLNDLLTQVSDVQRTLENLKPVCKPSTRLVINFHSNLWRPALELASKVGVREPLPFYNWLSAADMNALLELAGFQVVTQAARVLAPKGLPVLADLANRWLAKVPVVDNLCFTWFLVARPEPEARPLEGPDAPSVSIIVPTLDERGNIQAAFERTPSMGRWSELVFVDGGSSDGTVEEIERCREVYKERWPRTKSIPQTGKGKGQAVRDGFAAAEGEILMILDSDLTMPPEELPKYYEALVLGRGEVINGCRLVYRLEDESMRFLNQLGNRFFSSLFTWMLGQPIRDTLCGTKVLWRETWEQICANRDYFGDFDPFGDFDLLFGAARLQRRILDLPIRYQARTYGEIKIDRWKHGAMLLAMSGVAFDKFKLKS